MIKTQKMVFLALVFSIMFSGNVCGATYPADLHNGPMIGCMTDTSVRCWVRTASEVQIQLRVSTSDQMTNPINSGVVTTSVDYGAVHFTGIMEATGLEPETQYYYQVLVDGSVAPITPTPSFKTFPSKNARGIIKIGFGGGAATPSENSTEALQSVFDRINSHDLNAFLFLGDNMYVDNHPGYTTLDSSAPIRRAAYQERHSNTYYRNLISSKPIYAIWDDHDFAKNDFSGDLPDNDTPTWKLESWQIF
jgi:alkaline phosphatase D